jgi:hypothetical protein
VLTDDEDGGDEEHCPGTDEGAGILPVCCGLGARGLDLLKGAVDCYLHTNVLVVGWM